MKKAVLLTLSLALLAGQAAAGGPSVKTPSDLSLAAGLSVVIGSVVVLSAPVLLVSGVHSASVAVGKASQNTVRVDVTTEKGKETITLPRHVAEKANLQTGDKLDVKKTKAGGAVLYKAETPLAYIAPEGTGTLARSHELAK